MAAYQTLGMTPSAFWAAAFLQSTTTNPRQGDDRAEEGFWEGFAPDYDMRSPLASLSAHLLADVHPQLRPSDHLLEIGPGTGAFTKRLAPHVSRITAIEPSASMRDVLVASWPPGLAPLPELVAVKWEDAAVEDADVVFGANAFYRMPDMGAAITRMHAMARRRVILVQTIGRPHAGPLVLTQDGQIFERERAHAICDILAERGIDHCARTYTVMRADGPCEVMLIDWITQQ